ncbi:alpha-2-macroglobulin [Commensalibacter oyaizuii]|uniref:Alpha-2-macroglobulin n=1 Tax=Commensalibacter oyaizuii TaxID=3043873 RepID=A0ABT6PYM3_9PROT|nr:alpha-2-macroglobulin [Commensalibacter sp. TBRC 16381]MDI2089961.1 alpha-2-macroglobulin [Commensalibacter sp. TBRC 16381]
MQFIRFICLLPFKIIIFLLRCVSLLLRPIIGKIHFSWSAPIWFSPIARLAHRYQRRLVYILPSLIILVLGAGYGIYWYQHRPLPPIPNLVKLYAVAPKATDYTENPPAIQPLRINFSGSAAPLDKVGKDLPNEFPIQPEIKGTWRWVNDHSLIFTPTTEWQAGKNYTVDFSQETKFNPNIVLRNALHLKNKKPFAEFKTTAFDGQITSAQFQQDDKTPDIKKGIFEVAFNMPVDPISLEKNIDLDLQSYTDPEKEKKTHQKISFEITYDYKRINEQNHLKLIAIVTSAPLPIPQHNSKLVFTLHKGTKTQSGQGNLQKTISSSVSVPSRYTLKVQKISTDIVTDERNNSEQILNVEFNSPVHDEQVAQNISAWILPELKNNEGIWDIEKITPQTLSHFEPLTLTPIPAENNAQSLQSFKYKAHPNQQILVQINTGIQSTGGYVMGQQYRQQLSTPDYPKRLNFVSEGALLPLHGSNKISVVSKNISGIKLEVGQLRPNQLQHLVSFRNNASQYNQAKFTGSFSAEHITNRFEQKTDLATYDAHDVHYSGFDLSPYLHKGLHGVFVLRLTEYNKQAEDERKKRQRELRKKYQERNYGIGNTPSDTYNNVDDGSDLDDDSSALHDTRLVVITDLGMLVKKSLDGSQDVFIQSISTGNPVNDAKVSVVGLNGETLLSQNTDATGTVHFPTLQGFHKEKRPVMYVVSKGDDLSFLPIEERDRQLNFSRFDVNGDINTVHKGELSAYLFSDRGIYRTGEDFHIGIITKAADWTKNLKGIPLKVVVTDPTGKTYERQITIDNNGFNDFTDTLSDDAPNGSWQISLQTIDPTDKNWSQEIGSTTIKVKDFLSEQTRVTAHFSEQNIKGWAKPDQLKAIIQATNLFGTPAIDRRVQASLNITPFVPRFEGWKDYQFSDPDRLKENFHETLQEIQTNDEGQAVFNLDLKKYAGSNYTLNLLGEVYEPNSGRSVAATDRILVSANDYMIGYHSTDNLYNIKVNASIKPIQFIAINPQTNAIAVDNLKIRLVERRYVSVLAKQSSGIYKYESKLKETTLKEEPFSIAQKGSDYKINTDKSGDFKLVLLGPKGQILSQINYSVIGSVNLSRSLDRNAELQIRLNKKSFKPSEEIEVAIRAPYTGSGIITIEKDKVYNHTWFHTDTTSTIQHITVPPDLEGNGYVNVQFIRDPASDEIFMSPLSYGVVPFSVDLENYRNPLTLSAPKITKNRQLLFTLHSERPTRTVLWAVDQGILQVAHYQFKDPLQYFFSKKMLDVQTLQILDQILPEFNQIMKLAASTGGDDEKAFAQKVNPFKRKVDKPVVFWSGIVDVDNDKLFTYQVPDYFNGELTIMAMSVSDNQIGLSSTKTIVRDDFVLKPNAPVTLTPGDESDISVLVANNLESLNSEPIPITVDLKTSSQFEVIGPSTQTITLGEKKEKGLKFRIKALAQPLGSGDLTFTATYRQASTTNVTHVLLRPASTYNTSIRLNHIDGHKSATFDDLRTMYSNDAVRYSAISNLPIVVMQGLSTYLVDYNHACTEQLASRALALLTMEENKDLKQIFVQSNVSHVKNVNSLIDSIITKIRDRQNDAGAFGLWKSTPNGDNFVTNYVTLLLQKAWDNGKAVPQNTLKNAYRYIQDYAANGSDGQLSEMRNRAFSIYLLTKKGMVTTTLIASLTDQLNKNYKDKWKQDSTAAWLAASMKLLKQDEMARQLITGPLELLQRPSQPPVEDWDYSSYDGNPLAQDATILYLVSQHFPELLSQLSANTFNNILSNVELGYYNTLSSSLTIMAFDAYSTKMPNDIHQLSIKAVKNILKDQDKQQTTLATSKPKGLLQILKWNNEANALDFDNQSDHQAWYSVIQRGYDKNPPKTAINEKMEIIREYTDQTGKPISQIKVGQEVWVHLKFRSTDQKTHNNIAITDLLPGGFDLIANTGSSNADNDNELRDASDDGTAHWYPDFVNIQEDKILLYGSISTDISEYVYRIKATNAGKYNIPPAYGEGMYNPSIRGRSISGGYLTVVGP